MAETSELMKRPTTADELTRKRALELFMPKVIAYLGDDYSETERPSIEKQLGDVLSRGNDGYAMARQLERDGWAEDRGLLDLMDEGEGYLRKAHEELVSQWIRAYGITPARKIGDTVATTHWHRRGQIGTIVKLYEDRAEYGVHFPDQPATSWQLLRYEEVIDALVFPHAPSSPLPNVCCPSCGLVQERGETCRSCGAGMAEAQDERKAA